MVQSIVVQGLWGRLCAAAPAAVAVAALAAAPAMAAERAHPTGRWLVAFERAGVVRTAAALDARLRPLGVRRAGRVVPALGLATVDGPAAAIGALRRAPGVESVSREWSRPLRRIPSDPALTSPETAFGGIPGGAPIQWALRREGFYGAWDVTTGDAARVAIVDTGITGSHFELGSKIASADSLGAGDARTDPDGHGTHVAGLACASTNNGRGIAGAGWGCRLNVLKVPLSSLGTFDDGDVAAAIVRAADRRAHAINLSFGGGPPSEPLERAIGYAYSRGVVLVAAASNCEYRDQGAPASQLQPDNAPDIRAGRGLVVTAADYSGRRATTGELDPGCGPRVGLGPQVSLAAFGFFDDDSGPPGLISTYPPATPNESVTCMLELCPRRSLGGDTRYAYLQGTSMATPQVAALAALVAELNPYLSVRDKLVVIKRSARGSAWGPELGWGIIDAGAAVDAARRMDRVRPRSRAGSRHVLRIRRRRRTRLIRVSWSAWDPAGAARLIPSGVRSYDLYMKRDGGRYRRVRRGSRRRFALLRLRRGHYRFYTRAVDKAGNREAAPRSADTRLLLRRPPR